MINKKKGQAFLEFALILPLFLALLFVLFDLGRATYYYASINNAARVGARYGIVNAGDVSGTVAAAQNAAYGVAGGTVNPTVFFDTGDTPFVRVTVNYSFTPATPFVAGLISGGGSSINLSAQAQMYTE